MKKFRFPLRPVAILREHKQARTREAFAAAVRVFTEAENQLAAKQAEIRDFEKVVNGGRREKFRAADEISFWDAYRRVCDEEKKSEGVVHEARSAMEKSRQIYLEAHRAVKVIEKLEHQARTEHRLGVDREAQLESDELSGLRVARRLAASTVTSS